MTMNLTSLPSHASRVFPRSSIRRKLARTCLTAACSLALSTSAFAQVQDDFEAYADWAALGEPWITAAPSGSIFARIDSNNLFGQGTSNRMVDYAKFQGSAQAMIAQNAFSAEV